jgi:hypothetical protein
MNCQKQNNRIVSCLFIVLFLINLLVVLFPTWKGSFIWNYFKTIQDFESFYQLPLSLLNTCIFAIILFKSRVIQINSVFYLIAVLTLLIILSKVFTGFKSGISGIIFIPISYLAIFNVLPNYSFSYKLNKLVLFTLLIWCISPIIYLIVMPLNIKIQLFSIDSMSGTVSFGGFGLHRNVYGFYTGISIILLMCSNMQLKWKIILGLFLFAGLLLSESRSALIATTIAISFYSFYKNKENRIKTFLFLIFFLLISLLLFYVYSNFTSRGVAENDDSPRKELISGFYSIISKNFLWGTGEYTLVFSKKNPDGLPAHNFILQSAADYGIFVSFSFFALLYFVWKRMGLYSKTLWLFLFIVSLVQPYFQIDIPSRFFLFIALLGLINENEYSYDKNCDDDLKQINVI